MSMVTSDLVLITFLTQPVAQRSLSYIADVMHSVNDKPFWWLPVEMHEGVQTLYTVQANQK